MNQKLDDFNRPAQNKCGQDGPGMDLLKLPMGAFANLKAQSRKAGGSSPVNSKRLKPLK